MHEWNRKKDIIIIMNWILMVRPLRLCQFFVNLFSISFFCIAYSLGRRICLGESLARMELYIFFTHLMHQFRIEGSGWQYDAKSIDYQGREPSDFKIRAIPRD